MARDNRIDALKGVLISFVVLGHCLLWEGQKSAFANWIYLFHMPLFVFISGYLSHVNSRSFWEGIVAIAESYLVYQIIKGVLYGYSPLMFITTPASMMWYLFALVIWRCLYFIWVRFSNQFIPGIGNTRVIINILIAIVLFGLGLAIGHFSFAGKTFAISRIIVFAPFFWLGTMAQGKDFISFCKKIPCWAALVILAVTLGLIIWITPQNLLDIRETVRCVNGYASDNQLLGLMGRFVYYVLAIITSVALISIVRDNNLLCQIGNSSLKIYLFHGVLLKIMSMIHLPWNWWLSFIYFFLIMTSLYFFNRTRLSDYAIRPIHFMRMAISKSI